MQEPPVASLDAGGGVALGWRMQELYLAKLDKRPGLPAADHSSSPSLISWTDLSNNQKALVLLEEVQARLQALGLEAASADDFGKVATAFDGASEADRLDLNGALQTLHVHLITLTTASDPRMGKAYRLGFAMSETAFLPYRLGTDQFKAVLNPYRLENIQGWLTDLKSALPDHSSDAASVSLQKWAAWYGETGESAVSETARLENIRKAIRLQAETWRAILTGEKRAVDLLTTSDYLKAAGDMAGHVLALAATVVKNPAAVWVGAGLVAVVVTLAAIGVFTGGGAITAAIAVLGALGVTAGSISAAVQKALDSVQRSLWQADLSGAVGVAATVLPRPPAAVAPAAPATSAPPPAPPADNAGA